MGHLWDTAGRAYYPPLGVCRLEADVRTDQPRPHDVPVLYPHVSAPFYPPSTMADVADRGER